MWQREVSRLLGLENDRSKICVWNLRMTFVGTDKFELIIDRDRGWAATFLPKNRDNVRPLVLYDLRDAAKIGLRGENGKFLEFPRQTDLALCAVRVVEKFTPPSVSKEESLSGVTQTAEYTFLPNSDQRADSVTVPDLDWEKSKTIYAEVVAAEYSARMEKFPNAVRRVLVFK